MRKKGFKHSLETKRKMSLAQKGRPSPLKGRRMPEEHKKRIGDAQRGRAKPWLKGNDHALGTKRTIEQRRKISGENASNWRGGKSFEPYASGFTEALKDKVRERDNRICYQCKIEEGEIRLDVHHIDYNKKNYSENNLIALCHGCHTKTNFNREYWENYFKEIMETKLKIKGIVYA